MTARFTLQACLLGVWLLGLAWPSPGFGDAQPTSSDAAWRAAVQALDAGRFQEAADGFAALSETAPDVGVFLGWSTALEKLGRPTEALAAARRAQASTPRDPIVLRRIAQLQIALDAPLEALETLESWRRAAPADATPVLLAALVLRRIERLDDASTLLQGALSQGMRVAQVYAQAAFLHLAMGRTEAARRTADEGLGHFPDDGELVLARALAAAADPTDDDDAVALLRRALRLGVPDEAKARFELGSLLLDAADDGCDSEGIAELERARQLRPDSAPTHFRLGNGYRACGETAAAAAALQEFQRLNRLAESLDHGGRQVGARLNQAQTLAQEGRLIAALEEVEGALTTAPEDPRAWTLKAKILFSLERRPDAVSAARRARELSPGRVEPHYLEGLFLSRSGRMAEAKEALERALALDSNQAQALGLLAAVTAELGDFESAAEHFARALRLGADDAGLRLAYARVLAELGRDEESRRQMELYRALSGG